MSKFDDALVLYKKEMAKLGIKNPNEELLTKVTKGLGPSIYSKNAATVSCSKQVEIDRLKKNFLIKKLGMTDSPVLDEAIKSVCKTMGTSNRNKHRAIFYYLLVEKLEKEAVYA